MNNTLSYKILSLSIFLIWSVPSYAQQVNNPPNSAQQTKPLIVPASSPTQPSQPTLAAPSAPKPAPAPNSKTHPHGFSLPIPDFSNNEVESVSNQKTAKDIFSKPSTGGLESQTSGEKKLTFRDINRTENKFLNSRFSDQNIQQLDALLQAKGAEEILKTIKSYPDDPKLNNWLIKKAKEGHVLIMWDLAERYSYSDPLESILWSQAALLGTYQESATCIYPGIKQEAPAKFVERFPKAARASGANPWRVKEGVSFAIDLYTNLAQMPDPVNWLCKPWATEKEKEKRKQSRPLTGDFEKFAKAGIFSYDPKYFDEIRRRERNIYRKRLGLKDLEPTPTQFQSLPPGTRKPN